MGFCSYCCLQICDLRFSELIPCLDRNLIYQLKLKPNLALMEHYERHCPPQERRYNCLVPPPIGYKVGDWHCSCRSFVLDWVHLVFDSDKIVTRVSDSYKMAS